MPHPGYQAGAGPRLWWKVAMHLDEAQLALVNALAYNVDDPAPALAVQDLLREAQTGLLLIFVAKGILPPSLAPRPPAVVDEPPVAAAVKAAAYEAAMDLEAPR